MKISSISESDFFKELSDAKKESISAAGLSDKDTIEMGVIEQSEVHKLLSGSAEKNNELPVIHSIPVENEPSFDNDLSNDDLKRKVITRVKNNKNKPKNDPKKFGLK